MQTNSKIIKTTEGSKFKTLFLGSLLFGIFILLLNPAYVLAHPGRTDSYGCHTCRTNCSKWGLSSGEYHCHRAKSLPQPKEPIKSHYSETGGYISPAPEYKQPAISNLVKQKEETTKQQIKSNNEQQKESWVKQLFKRLFK